MAKQATAKRVEVAPQAIAEPIKVTAPQKPTWEIKDRTYVLARGMSPLTMTIPSKHTLKHSLLHFDEESGEQKEIRYATNQTSVFVEDQKGEATLGHIVFKDGVLTVPKQKQNLQKLLSIYHPLRGRIYNEFKPMQVAAEELDILSLQVDAMTAAREMDIDMAEAIMRVEIGSKVDKMSSKELRRDLLLFARSQPGLFLELASDDNVPLRNFAIKAVEYGIIKLAQDQRTFTWGSNGRKLMTVPFDEHPYSAMAAFFKTDEGLEIYRSIEKKFS
mgnify:CR=1 FL=1|tara:strand:- start:2353 stop:3174 length:822 start_codon:yes stop_codon:yes gene_type:complete